MSVPIHSASLCPSLPHSLTFDWCGCAVHDRRCTTVSNLCASQFCSSFSQPWRRRHSLPAARFAAERRQRRSDNQRTSMPATIFAPGHHPSSFRSDVNAPLNRSGGKRRGGGRFAELLGAAGEGRRIEPPEQRLHAAVPAELERMGPRCFAQSPRGRRSRRPGCSRPSPRRSPTGPSRPTASVTRSIIAPAATPTTGKPDACASTIDTPNVSSAMPET